MRAAVFDLETSWNPSLVELACQAAQARAEARGEGDLEPDLEAVRGEMSLSAFYGRVVGAGLMDAESEESQLWVGGVEREILESFWESAQNYAHFIAWNSLDFDLPWLTIRSALLDLRPSVTISSIRYRETNHCDLFQFVTNWKGNRFRHLRMDLATVCGALGVTPPIGTGSEIPILWEKRDCEAIRAHLVSDLQATRQIWRRLGCPGLPYTSRPRRRELETEEVPF